MITIEIKKDSYIDWSLGVKIWIYMTFLNN